MEVKEEDVICRLCLKKLAENYEPLEETVQYTFNFLTLCPNLTITDDPMMCETCAVNLKKCFDFKMRCLSAEDCVASFADGEDKKVDLQDIYSKVKLDGNIDRIPDEYSVCRLCLELVKNDASMSIRHDVDLIEILQKYFLEVDVALTDDIIVCTPCYNSLQFHVSFVNNYLSTEEKIDEYCKVEGVNYKGQVDLRDVATFMSKGVLNIENNSSLIIKEDEHENVDTKADIEIKFEDLMDVKQEKEELVNKGVQQSDNSSVQHNPSSSQSDREPQLTRKPENDTYEICPFETTTMYKCNLCDFETKSKSYIKKHMQIHKSPLENNTYKCDLCNYEANQESYLKRHMVRIHKTRYKCDLCNYETKWTSYLERHMIVHKSPSEITMFKCDLCDYEAKREATLKTHMVTHKTRSEIAMYKCELCDYTTKWKSCLKSHMLTHKTPSEITMFKCDLCDYEAKRKPNLKMHILTHKTRSEIIMYKCGSCDYKAKRKSNLKTHMLTHRTRSEITIYKCDICPDEAKQKPILKQYHNPYKSL